MVLFGIAMSSGSTNRSWVPEIVPIVLKALSELPHSGAMSEKEFYEKLSRLSREELQPRRLSLLVGNLPGGRVRFIINGTQTGDARLQSESLVLSAAA